MADTCCPLSVGSPRRGRETLGWQQLPALPGHQLQLLSLEVARWQRVFWAVLVGSSLLVQFALSLGLQNFRRWHQQKKKPPFTDCFTGSPDHGSQPPVKSLLFYLLVPPSSSEAPIKPWWIQQASWCLTTCLAHSRCFASVC